MLIAELSAEPVTVDLTVLRVTWVVEHVGLVTLARQRQPIYVRLAYHVSL